jgi:heptaprenyl diphosphate synthase
MYGARKLLKSKRIGFVGLGVLGALVSNITQLALASLFIFGRSARYIAPPFLVMGLVSGAVMGFFCEYFTRRSLWYGGEIKARNGTEGGKG